MTPSRRTKKVSDKEITAQHIEKLNEDHAKELEAARERIKELEIGSDKRHEEYTEKIAHLEEALDANVIARKLDQESHKKHIDRNVEAYLKLQEKNNELAEQNSNLSHSESVLKEQVTRTLELYNGLAANASLLYKTYEDEITRLRKTNKRNFWILGTIVAVNVIWNTYRTVQLLCH